MNKIFLLQQYEDGTYGYVGIDNLENEHGKVISEQDICEEREDYINRCGLTFRHNQYGGNLEFDMQVNDEDYHVRETVAEQGYGLEKLVNDKSRTVRVAVANQGYGLEKLINDERYEVRRAVANQGYGLDTLINDEDYDVRVAVANQGYGLEKLINDESCEVRAAVANQGYGLDTLINDEDYDVRVAVANQGYGLEKLINDESRIVRAAVAKQGYGLEKLVNDKDDWIRDTAREAVVKFEKEDIMLKGNRYSDCEDYIKYFISKNNPKAIAKILITQINNHWPCREAVYDLVKEYAEDNNIQPLFKILEVYLDKG